MNLWRRLRARIGNPLRWSSIDKCLLIVGGYTYLTLNSAVSNGLRLRRDEIEPYLSRRHLEMGVEALILLAALSAGLFILGWFLRRRTPEASWFVHLTVQFYCITTAAASYIMGPFTNPWAVLFLLASGAGGLVLLERRAVVLGLGSYISILLATTLLERLGRIPYAPIFSAPPFIDGRLSVAWVFLMGGGTLAVSLLVLVLLDYVIRRWREDEQVREKMAAIGETTTRIVHQTRHQLGLIGMSAHQIARHLEGLPPERTDAIRAELAKLEGVQQGLAEMLRTDLRVEDKSTAESAPDRSVSYEKLAADEINRLSAGAKARGVALFLEIDGGQNRVPREADKFGQALFNVIENAVAAARSRVTVRLGSDDATLIISIADDGPGIPEEMLHKVLEPFVTTKPDGTGMGLAIARAVAEEEGGRLLLRNLPRAGLEARFEIPVGSYR